MQCASGSAKDLRGLAQISRRECELIHRSQKSRAELRDPSKGQKAMIATPSDDTQARSTPKRNVRDGDDLRGLPLGDRKKRLARLLGKRRLGIVLSPHTAEDGATIFQQACRMGLEGIVSKRLSAPYRSGRCRDWLKVKNPDSPAMVRAREAVW
jgi:hypothetical protein